jgi:hypothetical protein
LVLGHMCHFNTHIALKFSNWRLIFLYYIWIHAIICSINFGQLLFVLSALADPPTS